MKLFLIAFAVIAAVAADVSHLPTNEYLPPVQSAPVAAAPTNEYLPPVQEATPVQQTVVEAAPAHELADDGYRYKTHRRVVYRRNRRDVSHLPSNEYLPPVQQHQEAAPVATPTNEYLPPVQQATPVQQTVVEAAPAHELADDGYRYKTHRRVVYRRNRRDVSHLPSNEYLPPVQQQEAAPVVESAPAVVSTPVEEVAVAVQEAAPAHELADDGYRYKTHRRVVYRRNRRDVSHLPSNEYLPPVQQHQEAAPIVAPTNEYLPPVQQADPVQQTVFEAAPAHELADDGYRYKTHRRVVYRRNRRDVSHLPSNEYLPPVQQQEAVPVEHPVEEVSAVVEEAAPAHELADDGYRYKTHRRVVYRRNRRDVSHLASNEYLPPVQEAAPVVESAPAVESTPVEEVAVTVQEAAPAHELADDGYRYKTHRRVVYRRNRRDVSHLASNEYLPPVQEAAPVVESAPAVESTPVEEVAVTVQEAAPAHELADDGYRYKTHRRVVYRRNRRDVSHLPSNEYLPPVQQQEAAPVVESAPAVVSTPAEEVAVAVQEAAPAHELTDDGYRYKTHRRVVYRRNRRDVSHLPSNEYLPPVQQQEDAPVEQHVEEVSNAVEEAAPAHELADDGYRYKTQRRVVYRRNRRDVSHLPSNEYLPPVQQQEVAPVEQHVEEVSNAVEEAAPAHELADDGYRYKTQRRVVYRRNRRDVSHLPSNEYLPPVQQQEAVPVSVPTKEYLAPVQQAASVQEVAPVEEAAPAHELSSDGYRYKTQRRVVYRRH